jgi:hypothetical protein
LTDEGDQLGILFSDPNVEPPFERPPHVSADKARRDFSFLRMGPSNLSRIGSHATLDKTAAGEIIQIEI